MQRQVCLPSLQRQILAAEEEQLKALTLHLAFAAVRLPRVLKLQKLEAVLPLQIWFVATNLFFVSAGVKVAVAAKYVCSFKSAFAELCKQPCALQQQHFSSRSCRIVVATSSDSYSLQGLTLPKLSHKLQSFARQLPIGQNRSRPEVDGFKCDCG